MQIPFKDGLKTLSPEELKILDDVIDTNPQFFAIVKKAWPEIGEAFQPFVDNDMGGGSQPMPTEPMMGPQSVLAGPQFRR